MKISLIAKFLKLLLYTAATVDAVLIVTLPIFLGSYMKFFADIYSENETYRLFIMLFLWFVGVFGFWIIVELLGMLRTIDKDPFVERNVVALSRMGFVAIGMAVTFAVKCIFFVTPLTVLVSVVMILCSLFSFTMSGLFKQAVAYKEENELTI